MSDPILVTEASRKTMRRYLETGDPVHEIVADAIVLAENRGVMATLVALGAQHDELGRLLIPTGLFDGRMIQERIAAELGRKR